jgi:hypothetical protein
MTGDEPENRPYEPWPEQDPWDAPTAIRGPQPRVPPPRQPAASMPERGPAPRPPTNTWARPRANEWEQPPQGWAPVPQQEPWPGREQALPPREQPWAPPPPADAPPHGWAPDPDGWPPPPGRPRRAGNTTLFVVLGVVLAVLLAGGGVGYYLWHRAHTATSSAAATRTVGSGAPTAGTAGARGTAAIPPPAHNPAATASAQTAEQAALDRLKALRTDSLGRVTLDGRWVAQIASKSVGITDPLQTASNGTHTFYAVDILAESLAARSKVADPSEIYVLWGTDFGKRSAAADGSPYWVTLVDAGFDSSGAVQAWCHATYSSLSPEQLADTCVPRTLSPPHD